MEAAAVRLNVEKFIDRMLVKYKVLEKLYKDLLWSNWNNESLISEISAIVHQIAGSGGAIGFPDLSDAALYLDVLLRNTIAKNKSLSEAEKAQANLLTENLLTSISCLDINQSVILKNILEKHEEIQPPSDSNEQISILFAEKNLKFANEVAEQLNMFGFSVEIFADTEALHEAIKSAETKVVLVDLDMDEVGVQELEKINAEKGNAPVVVISGAGDLASRIAAYRAGAQAYFSKPVDIGAMVDLFDKLLGEVQIESPRVVVVDNDTPMACLYDAILTNAGVSVEIVTNPENILQIMSDFRPGLVLMDLHMPDYNGFELAAAIRQQSEYESVPIVFLSEESNLSQRMKAMSLGGDDFIRKPIQPDYLITSVLSRSKRAKTIRSMIYKDSMTGLVNHSAALEMLDREIARAKRSGYSCSCAMIDVDNFKQINDTYGHYIGDSVLKNLSRLLVQRLRKGDTIGRYGGEEFIIIMPGANSAQAEEIMNSLLANFVSVPQHTEEGEEFTVSFSCGIADFPNAINVVDLLHAADNALYKAKEKGKSQIAVDINN